MFEHRDLFQTTGETEEARDTSYYVQQQAEENNIAEIQYKMRNMVIFYTM